MKEFESERRKNKIINDINSLLKNKIAIKWTAPEVLKSREDSYASEIWSFGITLTKYLNHIKFGLLSQKKAKY